MDSEDNRLNIPGGRFDTVSGLLKMPSSKRDLEKSPLDAVLRSARTGFFAVLIFSCAVNLLMLTGPLFMLQVYDRVLTSGSIPTLFALFIILVILYAFLGAFSFFRSRVLSRIGYQIDARLMETTERARLIRASAGQENSTALQDLTRIRSFLASNGPLALFDLPWSPIYLAVVFYIHPTLGWLAFGGIGIILLLTVFGEYATKTNISDATRHDAQANTFSNIAQRNSDAILAMGMMKNALAQWKARRTAAMGLSQSAGSATEWLSAVSRSFRFLLQSSILAVGAFYAVIGEMTPGTMIAASIIGGRSLAPIDQAIGSWKAFIGVRQARLRLGGFLTAYGIKGKVLQLPDPAGQVTLQSVVKRPPNSPQGAQLKPLVNGLSFRLEPGDGLGVIGPSGSGKSSLSRLLVGLWQPDHGEVLLDGASLAQWDKDILGQHIGYLPQVVEMLPGSVRANISRFLPSADDESVVTAAKQAHVHELILSLPQGYNAILGDGSVVLSGGQVQRLALARALFGNPALIVLDEPNSNLDAEGDVALTAAIRDLRALKKTVIVMAHRPSAIAAVSKLLVLRHGHQIDFGDRDQVLERLSNKSDQPSRSATD
ncbi:MAG: type I secretion system permease/ATPase [Pseudomonadota bacterium]